MVLVYIHPIQINMITLPTELIVMIITFLSMEQKKDVYQVSKKMKLILIQFFFKIPRYTISNYQNYILLFRHEYQPRIKTLILSGGNICVSKINLTNVDYNILLMENLNMSSVNEIKMLDSKISKKCKKIILCGLCLSYNFIESLKCLEMCETVQLYDSFNYITDYNYIMMCMKTLPKLRKFEIFQYKNLSTFKSQIFKYKNLSTFNSQIFIPITNSEELVTIFEKHGISLEYTNIVEKIKNFPKSHKFIMFYFTNVSFYDYYLTNYMTTLFRLKNKNFVISQYKKYDTILKFNPITHDLSLNVYDKINLSEIDYKKLTLKNINNFFYDVRFIDPKISDKCKEISFRKSFLNEHFFESLKWLNCKYISTKFGIIVIGAYLRTGGITIM